MRGNETAPAVRRPALLGIDLAGSSVTSVVTDLTGRVLAKAGAQIALSRPHTGWVEVDPLDWLAAAIVTVRRAVDEAGMRPQAIGLSGQMHGLVLIDAAGQPVRPAILRPDARAVLRLAAYRDLPDEVRRNLVNPPSPSMVGPMLSWIAAHEPSSYARTRWALQPKDWLRAQLTSEYCSEPSDASGTLLYDLLADEWSGDAVRRLGLDLGRLPAILIGAGHQAGLLSRSGADLIGLQIGTPVAAGAARTAAAALGVGLSGGSFAQVVLGPCPLVIASIRALPGTLPLTGETRIYRAATDHGWCVTAPIPSVAQHPSSIAGSWTSGVAQPDPYSTLASLGPGRLRRLALDIAKAVRAVTALAVVPQIHVRGANNAPAGLMAMLAELVGQPVHATEVSDPAARAAALLGARAAGLLSEEILRTGALLSMPATVELRSAMQSIPSDLSPGVEASSRSQGSTHDTH